MDDEPVPRPEQAPKERDEEKKGPELISSRTRSKVCEAKAIQTELTAISVGTNTLNVSFSRAPDAVLEFPEYHKKGTTDFTWSQSHDLRNHRRDFYAHRDGRDWWNKGKKSECSTRSTVCAKRASILCDTISANSAYFQPVSFSDRHFSCATSDKCSLRSSQLRGAHEKGRKLHNRLKWVKTRDDRSLSSCGAVHHASDSVLHHIQNNLQQAGSARDVKAYPSGRGRVRGAKHWPVRSTGGDPTSSVVEAPALQCQPLSTVDSKQYDEDRNFWPMGKHIKFDDGMLRYISYDIDHAQVIPQAVPAGPTPKESAEAIERFVASDFPGEDRRAVQEAKLRRQANIAAREKSLQDRATAFSQEMQWRAENKMSR